MKLCKDTNSHPCQLCGQHLDAHMTRCQAETQCGVGCKRIRNVLCVEAYQDEGGSR